MKHYSCSESSICQWDLSGFLTSLSIFIKLKFNIQIDLSEVLAFTFV